MEILVGRYPKGALQGGVELPAIPGPPPAGLPAELLTRRPDLAAARERLFAADTRVRESRAALLPRISLTAQGGTTTSELSDILSSDFSVWTLAGNLAQPILDGGRLRAGVKLAVEYEPGLLIGSCADTQELLQKMKRAAGLGVNLDLGHAICAGEDPVESFKALKGRVTGMHIEDIKGTKHQHLVPGEGDVDFAALLGGLRKAGWSGHLICELYPYADDPEPAARAAHAALAPLLKG